MQLQTLTPRRLAGVASYLLIGLVGTAGLTVALLASGQPLQYPIYRAFYLVVGPWTATESATVLVLIAGGVVAVGLTTVIADYLDSRGDRFRPILAGLSVGIAATLGGLVVSALLGLMGFLTPLVAAGVFVVAESLWLRRMAAWRPLATFLGGVPALAFLLLVMGVGLGWGGGYDLVAEPVSDPEGEPVADFDAVPAIRDDLFGAAGYEDDGTSRLPLRGYAHEARVARWLDRHGTRCRFLNTRPGQATDEGGSFLALHDGTVYRVSCQTYGD